MMSWAVEVSGNRFVVVITDVAEMLHDPVPQSLSSLPYVGLGALFAYQGVYEIAIDTRSSDHRSLTFGEVDLCFSEQVTASATSASTTFLHMSCVVGKYFGMHQSILEASVSSVGSHGSIRKDPFG